MANVVIKLQRLKRQTTNDRQIGAHATTRSRSPLYNRRDERKMRDDKVIGTKCLALILICACVLWLWVFRLTFCIKCYEERLDALHMRFSFVRLLALSDVFVPSTETYSWWMTSFKSDDDGTGCMSAAPLRDLATKNEIINEFICKFIRNGSIGFCYANWTSLKTSQRWPSLHERVMKMHVDAIFSFFSRIECFNYDFRFIKVSLLTHEHIFVTIVLGEIVISCCFPCGSSTLLLFVLFCIHPCRTASSNTTKQFRFTTFDKGTIFENN